MCVVKLKCLCVYKEGLSISMPSSHQNQPSSRSMPFYTKQLLEISDNWWKQSSAEVVTSYRLQIDDTLKASLSLTKEMQERERYGLTFLVVSEFTGIRNICSCFHGIRMLRMASPSSHWGVANQQLLKHPH